MVSLDQVRQLEARVNRAVEIIRVLREENRTLRRTVDASQARMKELEDLVRVFKSDQAEIERGLVSAIRKLDQLEDGLDVGARPPAPADAAVPAAAVPAAAETDTPDPPQREPGPPLAAGVSETATADRPGQLDIF